MAARACLIISNPRDPDTGRRRADGNVSRSSALLAHESTLALAALPVPTTPCNVHSSSRESYCLESCRAHPRLPDVMTSRSDDLLQLAAASGEFGTAAPALT